MLGGPLPLFKLKLFKSCYPVTFLCLILDNYYGGLEIYSLISEYISRCSKSMDSLNRYRFIWGFCILFLNCRFCSFKRSTLQNVNLNQANGHMWLFVKTVTNYYPAKTRPALSGVCSQRVWTGPKGLRNCQGSHTLRLINPYNFSDWLPAYWAISE